MIALGITCMVRGVFDQRLLSRTMGPSDNLDAGARNDGR